MPKRRASLRRTTVPSSRVKTTWSCFASAPFASPAMIRPDMPRCSSNSPVSSSSIRMYLPRRARAPISAPSSRSASIGGNGGGRSGRRNSAWTMRRPLMRRASPRRTVSTSGNSGIGRPLDKVRFGAVIAREYGKDYASCRMSEPETRGEAASRNGSRDTDFGFRRVLESDKAPLVRAIFDSVAPRYDLMNDLMSGGIHRWWKAEMIAWLNPRPGERLVDVAGGTTAPAAPLRSLQLSIPAVARPDHHRRPRRLYLSGREHPAISGAEQIVGADRGGRARAG